MAAAETTTTFHSERHHWARRLAPVAALSIALVVSVVGCHRRHDGLPPSPRAAGSALPVVPAPAGLLLRGAVRKPAEVYRELQGLVGGRARLFPTSLALAIATAAFDAPLSAGLVDDTAPMGLAVVDTGLPGGDLVLCARLTSGAELLASLTKGADAKFDVRSEQGVLLLEPRTGKGTITPGVVGDFLVLAQTDAAVLAAGPYLARTVAPALGAGPALELIAPKASLSGPLTTGIRVAFAALRARWLDAEAREREHHGGRAADFGDPSAVISAATGFSDEIVSVLGSSAEVRLTATLTEPVPLVRLELVPEATGAAHELTLGLEVGGLGAVLGLPSWVEAAVVSRSSATSPGISERVVKVLGERLQARERDKVRAWFGDMARGIGPLRAAGLFGDGFGVFALGTAGDGAALRRAVSTLPDVAAIRAIAEPLRSLAGKVEFVRPAVKPAPDASALQIRVSPKAAPPLAVSLMESSAGERVAAVLAVGDVGERLHELLSGVPPSLSVGSDGSVAAAVARAGDQGTAAILLHVQGTGIPAGFAVFTVGSDRRVTWAEVGASKEAMGVLVRQLVAE